MSGNTSYIIFTVLSQMAVGALIAMLIADFLAKSKEDAKFFETGAWVCVPVVVVGLIAMLSHEARPFLAMLTMNNHLATSWLSREVLALTLFVILAVVYTALWVCESEYGSLRGIISKIPVVSALIPALVKIFMPLRKIIGVLAAVMGFVVYLYASATSYMMYTMPAWNQPTTLLFFIVTTLLTGVTAVAAVLSVKYLMKKEADKSFTTFLWATTGIGVAMVVLLAVAVYANITMLPIASTEMAKMAQLATLEDMLHGEHATFLWLRVVIGIGLVLVCLVGLALALIKKSMSTAAILAIAVFVFAFIGELLGRTVFFGSIVPLSEVMPHFLSIV